MRRFLSLLFVFNIIVLAQAQDVYKFAIQFTDKNNTPFSINQPEEFLSQRSIDRRAKFNISYKEDDLPIDPVYIADVLGATSDAELIIQVKWMNTIIIALNDSANIDIIEKLPIVDGIECVFNPNIKKKIVEKLPMESVAVETQNIYKGTTEYDSAFYGGGWVQIHQLKGEVLHQQGYKGQDVIIAVLDAGFVNADSLDVFQPLWDNDQILGTANFVSPGETVFATSGHGTSVLSTMGGYWEGALVGTAPDASYWLIRTEDVGSEDIIEEYNWVAGAAFADSVGADVLNTSLGYTTFNDTLSDHTYDELDGNTTVITRGANMAFNRGMIPVNSAGNSGNGSWRYIGAPADGTHVFTVGAIDGDAEISSFSSIGFPWSDAVKPNVVARGGAAYFSSSTSNAIRQGNGTSFSSPIMAGMVASLWSANPALTPHQIKQAIQISADHYSQPDTLYGYGIPDFEVALSILGVQDNALEDGFIRVSPNPIHSQFYLNILTAEHSEIEIIIYNTQGMIVLEKNTIWNGNQLPLDISQLSAGVYILEVRQAKNIYRTKLNKL